VCNQGPLIGFVNLGNTNNQLLEFKKSMNGEQHEQQLLSSMLELIIRGLFQKLNYPYAQFACNNISGDLMFNTVWRIYQDWREWGFNNM